MEGIILRGIGSFYSVEAPDGAVYTVRPQGKLKHMRMKPKIGDAVEFVPGSKDEDGWLSAILPRKNELVRPPVANIDLLLIVVPAAHPNPDLLLIDQLLFTARKAAIPVRLIVNKSDLAPEVAESITEAYRSADVDPVAVSAYTGAGIDALRDSLAGKTYALAGQSGIGKTTLINALNGFDLETGDLSEKIERGKHTTRRVELLHGAGGSKVLDTPGFSLIETELMPPEALEKLYPEFLPFLGNCRFTPCAHIAEPDCAVKDAVKSGAISSERYERYILLYNEMKERWSRRYD